MRRAGRLAVLVLLTACGGSRPRGGGIGALETYEVTVDVLDGDLDGRERSLDFRFTADAPFPARCGSFGTATATFAGQPVLNWRPGGWVPASLSPFCEMPGIFVLFKPPVGEPQNGVLSIDGDGAHFEVPFDRAFGSPRVRLVSATFDKIVVGLEGFAVQPTIEDVAVTLYLPNSVASPPGALQKVGLSADGLLELSLPRGLFRSPTTAAISLAFDLGADTLDCVGFVTCSGTSRVERHLSDIEIVAP